MNSAKIMLAAAASCMSIAPTLAAAAAPTSPSQSASATANPAAKLSLSKSVRTSSDVKGSKAVSGGLYAALIVIGVAAMGVLAFTGDDGEPDSN